MPDVIKSDNLDEKQNTGPSPDSMASDTDPSSESETQTKQDEKADLSMNDFVAQQLKEQGKTVDKSEEVEKEDVAPEGEEEEADAKAKSEESVSENEKDETETEEVEEGEKEAETEEKSEEETVEKPVAYERFKEVNDRMTSSEAQVKAMKPEVDDYRQIIGFLQKNGIDRELFTKTMFFLADFQQGNIEKVAPQIREWASAVDVVEGNTLPADLQNAVDKGEMDLAVAKRIAKAEAKANMVEKRGRKTVEQLREEDFNRRKGEFDKAAETWETAKQGGDPDYKPKAKDSDPDGKWEDVRDKYMALVNAKDAQGNFINVVNTPADLNALQERAYQMVEAKLKRYRGNKPTIKAPLNSRKSVSDNNGNGKKDFTQAKSMGEAVRAGMKQLGYSLK